MAFKYLRWPRHVVMSALPLALLGDVAAGQKIEETKIAPTPKSVEDIKTTWEAPPKLDRGESPITAGPTISFERKDPERVSGFRAPTLADRVLFDQPGDGALWVKGGTSYKARFDDEGVTYFPFFGSSTPGHNPLALTLREVLVGDQPLDIAWSARHERAGDLVLFDRGALVEFYEMSPTSMEQKFLVESLPAGWDLVVRIAVQTELSSFETPEGFEFWN